MNQLASRYSFKYVFDALLISIKMLKYSLFNQSHFLKTKERGVRNFSFLTMQHVVYACMMREGGYIIKSTVAYSQGQRFRP